ncbi:MAG TPA: LuxR C-terminal-related transcriptional regulator, partial [Dehalococcoidia bacterium]|nr:LuxR C-terminal-related transcriptional regulator [Dehalococcoidia bacterium]
VEREKKFELSALCLESSASRSIRKRASSYLGADVRSCAVHDYTLSVAGQPISDSNRTSQSNTPHEFETLSSIERSILEATVAGLSKPEVASTVDLLESAVDQHITEIIARLRRRNQRGPTGSNPGR